MSYNELLDTPMSAIAFLYCAAQEKAGVDVRYRRSTAQDKAILDHMRECIDG
jgi:hypothetical protein